MIFPPDDHDSSREMAILQVRYKGPRHPKVFFNTRANVIDFAAINWLTMIEITLRLGSGLGTRNYNYSAIHPLVRHVSLCFSVRVARACLGSR